MYKIPASLRSDFSECRFAPESVPLCCGIDADFIGIRNLLKTEVPKYLKFDVLNEVQQSLFIDRNSSKSGLTTSTDLNGRKLERYKDTPHYLNAVSILREADIDSKIINGCSVAAGLDAYRNLLEDTTDRCNLG